MIVRDFLICLLQMYLLEDLEKNMLPYRRENFLGKFLVYFVIALVMLGINHLESSIFNMVMIPVTYVVPLLKDKDRYISTKRDADSHGIGLHTVGKLVKKYAGIMRVEVGEQEFSVKLIFTIK